MASDITAADNADLVLRLRERLTSQPGDLEAGLMLGAALYDAGDLDGSSSILIELLQHHPDQIQALLLLARTEARNGSTATAQQILQRATTIHPDNPQTWQMASALAAQRRDWDELRRIGTAWTARKPESAAAWKTLSHACFELTDFMASGKAYERVLALEPGNVGHLVSAARIATAGSCYDLARKHLKAAEALAPDAADVLFALSRLYQATGELALAEQYCRRSIAARPGYVPAYTTLGLLREGRLSDDEIAAVRALHDSEQLHPEYRAMAGYTLGNALDRNDDVKGAFAAWSAANAITRELAAAEGFVYSAEEHEDELRLLEQVFSEPFDDTVTTPIMATPIMGTQPIFVVGMPRSGTTLVESILAAHSSVAAGGELLAMSQIHDELLAVARQQGVAAARAWLVEQAPSLRARYLAALPGGERSAADASTANTAWTVDKLPQNFRSIGLIRLLFPASPIIATERDPMDVGLSIFRHNFARNWPCATDLRDIGHYTTFHRRLMGLWKARYPDAVYVLEHAALVQDQISETRRLLAFAGLSDEPGCFTPHKQRRAVATFSAVQVQQPVSARYGGQAKRYDWALRPKMGTEGIFFDQT